MKTTTIIFTFLATGALLAGGYGAYKIIRNKNNGANGGGSSDESASWNIPDQYVPGNGTKEAKKVFDKIAELSKDVSKDGVKKLQTYLNTELGAGYVSLKVDGVRGKLTEQAIRDLMQLTKERYGV